MSSKRINQINSLLHQKLGEIFLSEFNFPAGALVSITRAETTGDLRHAKIYLSVIPDKFSGGVLALINKRLPFLHHELMKQLVLQRIPTLHFVIDEREKKALKIEALLDRVKREEPGA
ncbi:30S ribosome-binding factor RbfA [Candidatus Parcubacteria bacterium]|jgi:ribosome-binding factor A|nr:MAG: 30S ribosome-binding factor RbfA [Candidatus Parcubacteria bacterium]